MDNYQLRKKKRKAYYEDNIKGWKQRKCTACNGSGYYDHDGGDYCGACAGAGKELYKPTD